MEGATFDFYNLMNYNQFIHEYEPWEINETFFYLVIFLGLS